MTNEPTEDAIGGNSDNDCTDYCYYQYIRIDIIRNGGETKDEGIYQQSGDNGV